MMKRLLLAVSVLALTAGGAYAQGNSSSPAPAPAAPPAAAAPAPAATGGGAMGQAPKASTGHAATHAASATKVKEAQQALQEAGLYKGKVDGKFGPQTKAAVKEFQKENGLKQTAHLDSATMKKLTQAGAAGGGMPAGGTTSH
ncbi:MAG TPA: peptidoglycan-binding domain-containing protein [Stellaceae bacterium]|nr:peptidoglycan-binding domain-containing protein [Stellaceae bacterium]